MYLVRHGQTLFNVVFGQTQNDPGIEDPSLTKIGRDQANKIVDKIKKKKIKRIISSPYTRTLETSQIVANKLGLPVLIDADIRERMAYTCDIGTKTPVLRQTWPSLNFNDLKDCWWNNKEEPVIDFHRRCGNFRTKISSVADIEFTLVVTHWGVIRSLTGTKVGNGEIVFCDPHDPHPSLNSSWP